MINSLSFVLVLIAAIAAGIFFYVSSVKRKMSLLTGKTANYENIINQANDAMLVIDIVDGRIYQANPSAEKLLGYDSETLKKSSLFDLHPREMLDRSSRVVADVWEKGGLIYKDIPFLTSAGELLPVECSAKVASYTGRPAIVIYARDIRERLRMEEEISRQSEIITKKNKDITDSINYAKGIQQAILPNKDVLRAALPDSFILMRPKDIVSGDFYWFSRRENIILVAAADCTGHGVPGALMSMIGCSFLNEVVNEKNILQPAKILQELRRNVIKILNQYEDNDSSDGMDIALYSLNLDSRILQFAGAFNPVWIIRNKELTELKGDKFPVGTFIGKDLPAFSNQEITLMPGDSVYVFTDGYADQFGGANNKKFKRTQLQKLLLSISDEPMETQKEILKNELAKWQGSNEQVDDILVMGARIPE